jgi:hypothetical protein
MKKIIYVALMAIVMFLVIPPPSDAGQSQVFVAARYGGGGSGYGGYHGGYGGYRGGYGAAAPGGGGHYNHGSGTSYSFGASILLGPPWYYAPYYSPYYYAAPPVVVQTPPPVYYAQPQAEPQAQPEQRESYWYYCQDPQGYYPYVKSCPGGWMKVVPDTTPPTQ